MEDIIKVIANPKPNFAEGNEPTLIKPPVEEREKLRVIAEMREIIEEGKVIREEAASNSPNTYAAFL